MTRRLFLSLTAAAIALASALASAGPEAAEPEKPKRATTRPAGTEIKYKVKQAPQFVALAHKAAGLKGVHVKGYVRWLRGGEDMPANRKQTTFETWTTPTLCRGRMSQDNREGYIVCDGKHVYKYRVGSRGRRKKLAKENLYNDLEAASVYYDAAQGYPYFADVAKFDAIPAIEEYDKKIPGLKWFQITGGKGPKRHIVRELEALKFGISPADGLVRVLYIEGKPEKTLDGVARQHKAVILMEQVTHKALTADDFKLPAEAATAKWRDSDTGKDIDPPKAVIAKPAKTKTEK